MHDGTRDTAERADERERMVRDQIAARGIDDPPTLAALRLVPRHVFVPADQGDGAYRDEALSIGQGQTISQPYMVARMTASLALVERGWPWTSERPTLLDVGTGSGYQAAILAQLGARVISIERDQGLAEAAARRLSALGYTVEVVVGDGSLGHPAEAPYAGIVVAAAAPEVPQALVAQLAIGARLVVPVGPRSRQQLAIVRRTPGGIATTMGEACVFVPLVGAQGHQA